ncbi:MAG: COX15/CtaA family protein [Chitinophagaceae bacterium]
MQEEKSNKIVSNWVLIGVAMLIIQVLIGGITRLSGSGLSITEWKPIMGALPPTSETEWQQLFEKYKQIAQYKYINNHFNLSDFKFIFFWEWFHRLWARIIAVAFAIPFVYFIIKKHIKPWMINPLIILFLLGAMQGLIGWIMVKSGLNDENVYVNHIKLSIHFVSAMLLISYALIFALSLRVKSESFFINAALKKATIYLITLLVIQLFYGAFMAGLKAANVAPTWPLINGMILPDGMLKNGIVDGLFFNKISIHFIHRLLAYAVFVCIIVWWLKTKKYQESTLFNTVRNLPVILVIAQVLLGIISVLTSPHIVMGSFGVFEWMALFHQLIGMLLLLSLIVNVYLIKSK